APTPATPSRSAVDCGEPASWRSAFSSRRMPQPLAESPKNTGQISPSLSSRTRSANTSSCSGVTSETSCSSSSSSKSASCSSIWKRASFSSASLSPSDGSCSEGAFAYRENAPSEQLPSLGDNEAEEKDARFHMLEQLADFDDELLEQLVSDVTPEQELVFADLVRELNEGLICPVFFGDSAKGWGMRRLLKALRHDAGSPQSTAERLGVAGVGA